jgi:hypothetical protein
MTSSAAVSGASASGLFPRDSIIVWHFRSFSRKRQRILRWSDDPAAPPVLRFTSSRQAEQWLTGLRQGMDTEP